MVNKPSKAYSSATVSSVKDLAAATAGYRKDLSAAATIRFSKLNCSLKRKAAGASTKKSNSRDARKAKRASA